MERALVLAMGTAVDAGDIDIQSRECNAHPMSFQDWKAKAVYEMEHVFLKEILGKHGLNITRAAQAAQIERRTFFGLLQKHKLTKNSAVDAEALPP